MIKQMGGKGGLFPPGAMGKNINPAQMAKMNQQMSKMMNPALLKQMGNFFFFFP